MGLEGRREGEVEGLWTGSGEWLMLWFWAVRDEDWVRVYRP